MMKLGVCDISTLNQRCVGNHLDTVELGEITARLIVRRGFVVAIVSPRAQPAFNCRDAEIVHRHFEKIDVGVVHGCQEVGLKVTEKVQLECQAVLQTTHSPNADVASHRAMHKLVRTAESR